MTPTKRHHPKRRHLATVILVAAAAAPRETAAQTIPEPSRLHQSQPQQPLNRPPHQEQRRIQAAPLNTFEAVKDEFDSRREQIENFVFQTLNAFSTNAAENSVNGQTSPSRLYTYTDFFTSLRSLSVGGIYGESYHRETNPYADGADNGDENEANSPSDACVHNPVNKAFYLSQTDPSSQNAMLYAVINLCAFLSNAMVESIQYDSCEELNGMGTGGNPSAKKGEESEIVLSELNGVRGRYFPMSNACGQFGRSYQENEESCSVDSDDGAAVDMSCPMDNTLEMEAASHPKYNYQSSEGSNVRNRPPPPFACGPKKQFNRYSGYWDGYSAEFVRNVAYPSALGKTDVEGCCFWGRGALSTKNVCNLGKFNYYMGKRAYQEGRPSRYPNIDFCRTPWIICDTNRVLENGLVYPELKWMVALFEWIDRIQSYDSPSTNWNYMTQLKLFVDRGAKDLKFIDGVSSIVARGCDDLYCSTRPIPFMEQRRKNFETLLDIFDVHKSLHVASTSTSSSLASSYDYEYAEKWIQAKRSKIEGNIFISQNEALSGMPYFSTAYRFDSFISALRTSALYGLAEDKVFFLGDESKGVRGFHAGLVNLAAFLSNVMVESIATDSCDEVNWDNESSGKYAFTNSCGQNGRIYSEESCPTSQSFMSCQVQLKMQIRAEVIDPAKTPFLVDTRPPELQCHPNATAYPGIQGCCWWGRGALSTKGTCNMGKLNFHLGARANSDNRPSQYPDINFCTNPGAICSHNNTMEIRWVVAMFEWIDRVQTYYDPDSNWEYISELYNFVDGGMKDESFVEATNNILAKGCHFSECSTASAIKLERYLYGFERKLNVLNILRLIFDLPTASVDSVSTDDSSPACEAIPNPFVDLDALKQQLFPTAKPTVSPTEAAETLAPTSSPEQFKDVNPTNSPVEFSNITIFNDGSVHVIDKTATSFQDESLIVTDKTTLVLNGGNVTAPTNSEWPAIRLKISSKINATSGVVQGSIVSDKLDYGGGEAIQLNNGQSSPETAGYGEFYSGIKVLGGHGNIGGDALVVNGFGTEAVIYGGTFIGGSGVKEDLNGYSILVINSATVHIHGGVFVGDIKVEGSGMVLLYGCFTQNGTEISGLFGDGTELNATIDGDVDFKPAAGQECGTMPSVSPTQFPTISHQPTATVPNGSRAKSFSKLLILLHLATSMLLLRPLELKQT